MRELSFMFTAYKNVQATMEISQTFPGKKRRATPNSGDQEEFVLKVTLL